MDKDVFINNGIVSLHVGNVGMNIINTPFIPYYHGNTASMWDYLMDHLSLNQLNVHVPRIERKQFLKEWLKNNKIVYSDIIYATQRKNYTANDKALFNIIPNYDLIKYLFDSENVRYLLFNSGSSFGGEGIRMHQNLQLNNQPGRFNVNNNTKSFDLFIRSAQDLGIKIYFRIIVGQGHFFDWTEANLINADFLSDNLRNKIQFELKMDGSESSLVINSDKRIRNFEIITGPSPSRAANLGVTGNLNFQVWNGIAGNNQTVSDFIKFIYQSFRDQPDPNLYHLNVG